MEIKKLLTYLLTYLFAITTLRSQKLQTTTPLSDLEGRASYFNLC